MSSCQVLCCLLHRVNVAVDIDVLQSILLLNFYHTLLRILLEDGGRTLQHVAESMVGF